MMADDPAKTESAGSPQAQCVLSVGSTSHYVSICEVAAQIAQNRFFLLLSKVN